MTRAHPRHMLGAPLRQAEREAAAEGLLDFFGGDKRAVIDYYVKSADRIMTKAIGLMTAESIFAAIALFASEKPRWGWLGGLSLILLIVSVILCSSTLLATSAGLTKDQLNHEAIARHGLNLFMSRTIRLTLALYFSGAAVLLILYRRFVQHRPISGPGAEKFPDRGVGIERMREGFRRAGIDPDDPMGSIQSRLGGQKHPAKTPEAHPDHGDELERLKELHDEGVLTDDEYAAARERLRRY